MAEELAAAARQVTAQQLWERLRARRPGLGRATVFRALEALTAAGLARRLEGDGHVYGYVACRPTHHHHVACRGCGRVEDIDADLVDTISGRVRQRTGFEIDDARMDFYGLCGRCRADVAGLVTLGEPVPG